MLVRTLGIDIGLDREDYRPTYGISYIIYVHFANVRTGIGQSVYAPSPSRISLTTLILYLPDRLQCCQICGS